MYDYGQGVHKDDVKAANWIQKAALANYIRAEWVIGDFYRVGHGEPQSYSKAFYWYGKALWQQVKSLFNS